MHATGILHSRIIENKIAAAKIVNARRRLTIGQSYNECWGITGMNMVFRIVRPKAAVPT
jgi:hypothetical protein